MATITKYNIPRSSNSGENNGSNSVASLGGGLGLNEIKESFLPAKPTNEELTKYDVEVEGTFKKNVTLPSITLQSTDGSKTATISLDTNGNIIVDKALISYSDLVAYGANGTYVDTVISLIHQVLEEEGVSGGGDVNWGGITGTGNAVTNITYDTTTKQLSAVKGATFLTEHQSLDDYATTTYVNSVISGRAGASAYQDTKTLYEYVRTRNSFIGTYKNTSNATWYNVIWDAHGDPDENGVLMWKNMQADEGWKIRYLIQHTWYTERTLAYTDSTVYSAGRVRIHNHNGNDTWYPVVWSNSNNGNSDVDTQLFKSNSNFMYNPNKKTFRVSKIESLNSNSSITLSDDYLSLGYNCVSNGKNSYIDGKNIYLRTGDSWSSYFTTSIDNNGRVGIGFDPGNATTRLDVLGAIRSRAYNAIGNNNASFIFDKPGTNYSGIGSNAVSDQIHFGPCGGTGTWVSNYYQIFDFQGRGRFESDDWRGVTIRRTTAGGAWLKFISNGNAETLNKYGFVGLDADQQLKLGIDDGTTERSLVSIDSVGNTKIEGRLKTNVSTGTTGGGGLDIGNCQILQIADSLIIESTDIRFGAKNVWDWSKWAGLKYDSSNKKIYLGIADGSTFKTNPATNYQTGGNVQLVNCGLVASGDVTAYSDARLKSDIKDLEYRGSLSPKTYVKDGKKCIGFIAQEVRELYPELVQGEEKEDEYLSLNYGAITAVLAAENKELRKRIERLEAALLNR